MKKKKDLANEFGIPANIVSTILKNKDAIMQSHIHRNTSRKRKREECLIRWIKQCRSYAITMHTIRFGINE